MASNIRDIKVNISGDASALKASLKEVNNEVGKTQRELSNVERLLKMDPGNMDLLREKQELLTNSINSTKDKLNALKEAKKKADDEGIKNTEYGAKAYNELINQIAATEASLNKLEKSIKEFGNVNAAKIASIGKEFQDVGSKIEDAGKKLSVFSAAAAGVVTAGVSYNAQMQKYETAITTLTGSAEKASQIMEQIKEDASSTPFDVSGLTQATQLLLSTGLEAEDARETILALGDAISATGGGDAELSRMAVNLQQIKNLGKASSIDIKQFANAGIDVYGLLADYLGVSKQEAAEMTISWEDLNGALIAATQEGGKYFGAMQAQSKTFNGAISNLKDSLGQLVGSLTESLMPVITQVVQSISALAEWFKNLSPETQSLIANILLLVAALGPALIIIGKLVSSIGTIMTLIPLITSPVTLIVIGITAVIAALVALYVKCEWFRNAVNTLVDWIKTALTFLWDVYSAIFGKVKDVIEWYVNYQKAAIEAVVNFFTVTIPNAFNAFLEFLKTAMQFLISYIIDPIGTIKGVLQELLPGVYEWASKIMDNIKKPFSKIKEVGTNLVKGLFNGIKDATQWLYDKISGWVSSVLDYIKDLFGIASPSKKTKVFGKYLAQGLGVGFEKELPSVISSMTDSARKITDAISTELDVNAMPRVKSQITSQNYYTTNSYQKTTEVVRQPSAVTIEMDKKVLGQVMVPVLNERNKVLGANLSWV